MDFGIVRSEGTLTEELQEFPLAGRTAEGFAREDSLEERDLEIVSQLTD